MKTGDLVTLKLRTGVYVSGRVTDSDRTHVTLEHTETVFGVGNVQRSHRIPRTNILRVVR